MLHSIVCLDFFTLLAKVFTEFQYSSHQICSIEMFLLHVLSKSHETEEPWALIQNILQYNIIENFLYEVC